MADGPENHGKPEDDPDEEPWRNIDFDAIFAPHVDEEEAMAHETVVEKEAEDYEDERRKIDVEHGQRRLDLLDAYIGDVRQDTAERKTYAKLIFRLVVVWLVGVFIIIIITGSDVRLTTGALQLHGWVVAAIAAVLCVGVFTTLHYLPGFSSLTAGRRSLIRLRRLTGASKWVLALLMVMTVLVLRPWTIDVGGFQLSDSVLIALISGTTVNVIALFAIVARSLFPRREKDLGPDLVLEQLRALDRR